MKITTESFIGGCSYLSFFVADIVCRAGQLLDLRSLSMGGLKYFLNKYYKVDPTQKGQGNNNPYYYID